MANWYTGDIHFGHENIIPACGRMFRHADQMDEIILEKMWEVVQEKDDLWIVGDFSAGPKAKDRDYLEVLFNQLPGARKHLVVGNHDFAPTLALPWDSVAHLAEVQDGPEGLCHTICHYPMITWNHARTGALQLFGHVHHHWQGSRNSVNVGVDQWGFMPVSLEQVAERAKKLPVNLHWDDVEPGWALT